MGARGLRWRSVHTGPAGEAGAAPPPAPAASDPAGGDGGLLCPRCATAHPLTERFCPVCRLPLVYAVGHGRELPLDERQRRARKVKPQYAEGELVRVAGARNLMEAEFLQGLLLEEGIPSMLRRARGFDVPDFLAAGPRDILVAQSGESAAREVLLQSELIDEGRPATSPLAERPLRLLAGLLVATLVVLLIVVLGMLIAGGSSGGAGHEHSQAGRHALRS
jgi:hypothetical protein